MSARTPVAHAPGDSPLLKAERRPSFGRALGPLLLATGAVGLLAAFVLAVEKYRQLANPLYVPSCSLSEVVSCGSVMSSDQAELFGFPNPLLGVVGFSVLATTGAALLTGARLGRWYWLALQVGVTAAVVFVHWLIFQTLYRIGAVCPYCMVVWAATIPAFWYVTLHNAGTEDLRRRPAVDAMVRNHGIVLTTWLLLVAALVVERFWAPWDSLFV